jgi:hypothetical protein
MVMVKSLKKMLWLAYKNITFLAGFDGQGVVNNDPTVWLGGA